MPFLRELFSLMSNKTVCWLLSGLRLLSSAAETGAGPQQVGVAICLYRSPISSLSAGDGKFVR